jgi:hypothetical protein
MLHGYVHRLERVPMERETPEVLWLNPCARHPNCARPRLSCNAQGFEKRVRRSRQSWKSRDYSEILRRVLAPRFRAGWMVLFIPWRAGAERGAGSCPSWRPRAPPISCLVLSGGGRRGRARRVSSPTAGLQQRGEGWGRVRPSHGRFLVCARRSRARRGIRPALWTGWRPLFCFGKWTGRPS